VIVNGSAARDRSNDHVLPHRQSATDEQLIAALLPDITAPQPIPRAAPMTCTESVHVHGAGPLYHRRSPSTWVRLYAPPYISSTPARRWDDRPRPPTGP
jgi:hypothetical protein